MACHFSPYGTAITNLPAYLPENSLLILNDRTPINGHDPQAVAHMLLDAVKRFRCKGILLDFQNGGCERIVEAVASLPCPVAVTEQYAGNADCAVFLSAPPVSIPLIDYIAPWKGREVWLEAALEAAEFTITPDGCRVSPLPYVFSQVETFIEESLHCRYRCQVDPDSIRFHLYRTADRLEALLREASSLGIEKAIGLYQQLK